MKLNYNKEYESSKVSGEEITKFTTKMHDRFLRVLHSESTNFIRTVNFTRTKQGSYIPSFPLYPLKKFLLKEDIVRLNLIQDLLFELVDKGFFLYFYKRGKKSFRPYYESLKKGVYINPWTDRKVCEFSAVQRGSLKYLDRYFQCMPFANNRVVKQGIITDVVEKFKNTDVKYAVGVAALAWIATDYVSSSTAIAIGAIGYAFGTPLYETVSDGVSFVKKSKRTVESATNLVDRVTKFIDDAISFVKDTVKNNLSSNTPLKFAFALFGAYTIYRLIVKEVVSYAIINMWLSSTHGETLPDMVKPQSNQGSVGALFFVIVAIFFGVAADKAFRNYSTIKGVVSDTLEVFTVDGLKTLVEWLGDLLGFDISLDKSPTMKAYNNLEEIEKWLDGSELELRIATKQDDWERLRDYERELPDIRAAIENTWSRSESTRFSNTQIRVKRLWTAYQSSEPSSLKRMRPINIMLSGGSNVGKTTAAQMFAKFLSEVKGENTEDNVFVYSQSGNFPWQSYLPDKHNVVIFDEFMQISDPAANGQTLTEWYKVMENMPYVCDTAFEDKGKKRYKADMNVFTTNNGDLKQSGIQNTEAFFKRLDLDLVVTRTGNKWKFTERGKLGYTKQNVGENLEDILAFIKTAYVTHLNERDALNTIYESKRVEIDRVLAQASCAKFTINTDDDKTKLVLNVDPYAVGVKNGILAHHDKPLDDPYDMYWGQVLKELYTLDELKAASLHSAPIETRTHTIYIDWKPTAYDYLQRKPFVYDVVTNEVSSVLALSSGIPYVDDGYFFGVVLNKEHRKSQDDTVFYTVLGLGVNFVVGFAVVMTAINAIAFVTRIIVNAVSQIFSWFAPEVKPQSQEAYTKSQVRLTREGNRSFRTCTNKGCGSRINLAKQYCGNCGTKAPNVVERQGAYNIHAMARVENNIWGITVCGCNGVTSTAAILMLNSQHGITSAHTVLDTDVEYISVHKEGTRITMYPNQYRILHDDNTHNVTIRFTGRILTSVRDISDLLPDEPVQVTPGTDIVRTRWDVLENEICTAEGMVVKYMATTNYQDTCGERFVLAESYVTNITLNAVGYCGSPYFIYDKLYKGYILAGIHVAADSSGRALVSCISKLDLPSDFRKGVVIKQHKVCFEEGRPFVPAGTHSVGQLRDTYYAANGTKYAVSPLHELSIDPYPVLTHFPLLDDKPTEALMKSTRFHHHKMRPLVPAIDDIVTSRVHSLMKGFWRTAKFRELTVREAVMGFGKLKKLDMTTSVGPTLIKHGYKERSELFDSNTGWIDEKLLTMIKVRQDEFDSLQPTEYLCALALKDEPLPYRKVTKRVFYVYDLVDLIVLRQKFGYMMHHQLEYHVFHGSTVGINPHSVAWTLLAKMLCKHKNFLDSDYSKLDVTISEYMFRWFWLYIIRYYGYEKESHDAQVMYVMIMAAASPLMVSGRRAFRAHSLNTSGWFLTLLFNDFVTQITHRVLMEHYWTRAGFVSLGWLDHVVLKSYGDDMVKSFSDTMRELFTPQELADDMLSVFGLVLTNADKNGPGTWKTRIEDVDFISRSFKPVATLFYAPLVEKSFTKMTHWVQKSSTVATVEVLQSIVYTAMHELLPKGKTAYEDFIRRYAESIHKLDLNPLYMDYDFMYNRYREAYTNTVSVSLADLFSNTVVGDYKPNPVKRCVATDTESRNESAVLSRSVGDDKKTC